MADPLSRPDPAKLLEAFLASNRSEKAFTKLVEKLGGLVFSCSLRRGADRGLAEEITQNVFAILARKAESLRRHACLTAWILETTRIETANARRAESRRRRKLSALADETSARNPESPDAMKNDPAWKDAVPILDDVLGRLPQSERKAVLQRFYEGKKFREIAADNGQTEGAAKMRVKRGLEKLSRMLSARGISLSATVIASALGTEIARSAPAQAATLMAPKALAASSSISTTAILTNTILTMSTFKTTTITAAAVIAIACIPFSRQLAEGSRLQSELQGFKDQQAAPGNSRARSKGSRADRSRGDRAPAARTADNLLDSLNQPVGNRAMIGSLLEVSMMNMDPMQRAMLWSRVSRMSADQQNQLLADLQKFPCERSIKDMLMQRILEYAPQMTPPEQLERMITLGRENQTGQSAMADWAKKDPDAAMAWDQEKRASGELDPGLNDELHNSIATELLLGIASSRPEQAFKFFRDMPRNEMDDYALKWLAGSYGAEMIKTGDNTHVMKLLEFSAGKDRTDIIGSVFGRYGELGKLDEGLAFVDAHNTDPAARFKFIEGMVPWAKDIDGALDWALSITPEAEVPQAARRLVATARKQRHTAGEAAREWLERQPAGPVRDQGYAGMADAIVQGYMYLPALEAADKIGDPSLRDTTRQSIGRTWLKRDKEKASKGLPADLLEQLQNQ